MSLDDPFKIKVGDLLPVLARQLLDGNGAPVSLALASSVTFGMRPSGVATTLIAAAATITNASLAICEYDWLPGETAGSVAATQAINYYQGEFQALMPGSKMMTFPNQGYIPVVFLADIV